MDFKINMNGMETNVPKSLGISEKRAIEMHLELVLELEILAMIKGKKSGTMDDVMAVQAAIKVSRTPEELVYNIYMAGQACLMMKMPGIENMLDKFNGRKPRDSKEEERQDRPLDTKNPETLNSLVEGLFRKK